MDTYDLQDQIDIAAPLERVWDLVHDVMRMPEWSPQVTSVRLRSGYDGIALGTQFTNRNRQGELEWTTHGEIVRLAAGEELAFRIEENWVIWSFTLTSHREGTRLIQRRRAPEGISPLSTELTEGLMGGQEAFTTSMRAGMRETLEAIKAAAENVTA